MAHINSLGAGLFSDLAVAAPTADLSASAIAALQTAAAFNALFATEISSIGGTRATGTFVRIPNIREFPSIGTPSNIVNVPRYGSKVSAQIQGQADAPSLELSLNYTSDVWAKDETSLLGTMVGDGILRVFRFVLLNSEPTLTTTAKYASTAPGIGTVQNSIWYFAGKIEALLVSPQLTDANQATLTLSAQSDFFGAYTI
jgi:hypothetical protein